MKNGGEETRNIMRSIIFACLFAITVARPDSSYEQGAARVDDRRNIIKILRDDRFHPDGGSYSMDFETEDGIVRSESGSPLSHAEGAVGQQGSYSFPLPNGEIFTMKFVANENGFQPESPFLPVAPEFPHPIPQFVLDQIEKARREDEEAARSGSRQSYATDSDEK